MHTVVQVLTTVATPTPGSSQRWDPPWLEMLVAVAVVLVALAVLWWLFLVVRIQDRLGGDSRPRRRR